MENRAGELVELPRFSKQLRITTARTFGLTPACMWLSAAASVSTGHVVLIQLANQLVRVIAAWPWLATAVSVDCPRA